MPRPTSRSIAATDRAEGHATPSVGGKSVIQWLRRGALAASLACAVLVTGPAFAAKKAPPIAEPMYLSAYANMVTRNFGGAIKPLTHLVGADPTMAGFRNALALALFTAHPEEHEAALQHAKKAMALKPKVPQFVVTYILTDRSQWKVEADGTARLTRTAALQLAEVTEKLLDMSGNAKKLGRLLDSLEETGGDPDFPFVLVDYKKLIAKPSLVLTRPDADEFAIAQKAIVERISNLKKKLNADKKVAEENTREAVERKDEIDQQVAEATALQEERNAAKARAMAKLQETAIEAAASSKRVAELERQRQLAAEVEERRAAGEIQIAAAEQATRDIRLAKEAAAAAAFEEVQRLAEQARIDEEARLSQEAAAATALNEAERIAEEDRIAEARRVAEQARQTAEIHRAEEEARRKAEEQIRLAEEERLAAEVEGAARQAREAEKVRLAEDAARLVEEKRLAIVAEDAARRAREELALIAKAEEEARKEQEALAMAQELAGQAAEEAKAAEQAAAKAAKADIEELLALIAKQQELLDQMLTGQPPLIEVRAVPDSFELGEGSFQIAGVVGDADGPPRLVTINGQRVPLFKLADDADKIAEFTMAFRYDFTPADEGAQKFVIEVTDASETKVTQEVAVTITVANRPNIQGKNFALIIGNNDYDLLPTLKTAVGDAEAVADVLETYYDFDEGTIKLLTNATRREILGALSKLRRSLTAEDRLLIYYAGHGQIDPATDEGFWQPVDSEPESDFTWISNADVKRYLGGMPAKHVLVIADSCFSGSLTRGATTVNENEDKFFLNIDKYPSRKIISSGGTEPVADSGSGGHSVFAYYLIKVLSENTKPYITSFQLYDRLVRGVTNNSNQTPEFGTVPDSGDQGSGDFTFIRRSSS